MQKFRPLVHAIGSSRVGLPKCPVGFTSVQSLLVSSSANCSHYLCDLSLSRPLLWTFQAGWQSIQRDAHGIQVERAPVIQAPRAMSSLEACRKKADSPSDTEGRSHADKQTDENNGKKTDTRTNKQDDATASKQTNTTTQADTKAGGKADTRTAGKRPDSHTPDGLKLLGTQVAGHQFGEEGRKLGMLDRGDGIVLKAVQGPPRGPRERNFYKTVFDPDCQDPELLELRSFLPWFYGSDYRDGVEFLMLHNVTFIFSKPNVLDLKMGRITYDPEATPEKREHETAKYPPLPKLGFQIIGIMTHNPVTGVEERMPKKECRSVTEDAMLTEGLGRFFGLQHSDLRKDVIAALLVKLRRLEQWFLRQKQLAFYASSLLIVYDNARPDSSSKTLSSAQSPSKQESDVWQGSKDAKSGEIEALCNGEEPVERKRRRIETSSFGEGHRHSNQGKAGTAVRKRCSQGSVQSDSGTEESTQNRVKQASGQSESEGPSTASHGGLRTRASEPPLVELRMIDFAHVFPSDTTDENYLFGLKKLISLLEQLLEK